VTLTIGSNTYSIYSTTQPISWPAGSSGWSGSISFSVPDLGLRAGTYSGTLTISASLACVSSKVAAATASVPISYVTPAALPTTVTSLLPIIIASAVAIGGLGFAFATKEKKR
jgi:hypothetical protein